MPPRWLSQKDLRSDKGMLAMRSKVQIRKKQIILTSLERPHGPHPERRPAAWKRWTVPERKTCTPTLPTDMHDYLLAAPGTGGRR